MSFSDYINDNASTKVSLVWLHPKERIVTGWTTSAAPIYSKVVPHYVTNVLENGTELTEAASSSLSTGEFFFDDDTKTLHVRSSTDLSPSNTFFTVDYRLFYATYPYNLPEDLNTGREVEYEGRLKSVSKFTSQVDSDDLTGVALSGSGTIALHANDGHFDDLYDKMFWEGTEVSIYNWNPRLLASEAKLLFKGFVNSKSFTPGTISFGIKDQFDKLRHEIPLGLYSLSDGDIPDQVIGTPKRRIYGRVAGLKVTSLDQVLDGFELSGTHSGTVGSSTITVSGGDPYAELAQGDRIFYISQEEEVSYTVKTVLSASTFQVSDDVPVAFSGEILKVVPNIAARVRNRTHLIAGHKLKEYSTTVTNALQFNRFDVADTTGFEVDDFIYTGSERAQIRRISNGTFVLYSNLNSTPSGTVTKAALQKAYLGKREMVFSRDYTLDNSGVDSKIVIDSLAEFNLANARALTGTIALGAGSRSVTGTSTFFEDQLQPRDWIKTDDDSTWYEVLSIESDTALTLVEASGIATTYAAQSKRPTLIDDSSIITVDCFGKTKDGTAAGVHINTAADAVEDLLKEQALTNDLASASFTQASIDAPYQLSVMLPLNPGAKRPKLRDIVNAINKAAFGSLYLDSNLQIAYSVLTPKKGTISQSLKDDDILKYSIKSTGKNIVKTTIGNYQHVDYGRFTEQAGALSVSVDNDFIEGISDIKREEVVDLHLYKTSEATIMTQRVSLLREAANTTISASAKMNLSDTYVNDIIYLQLDRLFNRMGTSEDSNRIGVVTKISKTSDGTAVDVSDLSGLYNKICVIAPSGANIYSDSTITDRANYGFITDSGGTVGSDNDTYKTNIIG